MRSRCCVPSMLLSVVLFSLLLSDNAYAYLDPGTGSYILQLLIAGLIGALFTLRVFWAKVVSFFRNALGFNRNEHKGDD